MRQAEAAVGVPGLEAASLNSRIGVGAEAATMLREVGAALNRTLSGGGRAISDNLSP